MATESVLDVLRKVPGNVLGNALCQQVEQQVIPAVEALLEAAKLANEWIESKGVDLCDGDGKKNLRAAIARFETLL